MPGHDGSYRGVVLDAADPMSEHRLQVRVPDVSGDTATWAGAEDQSATLPGVGDEVTIRFLNGDADHPLWSPGAPPAASPEPAGSGRFGATYRGTVVDNADPGGYRRVAVQVPDVSTETQWAMPEQSDAALPAIGDEVVIRYRDGDVEHPLWSGGSGGGDAQRLAGPHRGSVLSNQDPAGLGRLYVQVPGVADGVWATPEQAPPAIGDEVTVRFESADHATWSR